MADQAPPAPPDGRFFVAFDESDDGMWVWEPVWTRLDSIENLVTSYSIDRGRQFELDRTDTGRAVVEVADPNGLLDPTNTSSPLPQIEPLLQAMIGRRNPVTGTWHTRFRGWIEQLDYSFDPSQRVNRLTIQLVDIFEILAAIEMQPGEGGFGDSPPTGTKSAEVVYFEDKEVLRDRLRQAFNDNAGIPEEFCVFFSGNVSLWETSYSPGESLLTVAAECVDAELPGVANIYTDRTGRFVFHGRLAKFTPEDVYTEVVDGALVNRWDWHTWDVGDRTAVLADPANCSQIRELAYDRGLSKIINSASATPIWSPRSTATTLIELSVPEINAQYVKNQPSIDKRGIRSWSAQNLLTFKCNLASAPANALQETKKFAQYLVDNYKVSRNRIGTIGFRSIQPTDIGAAKVWELLTVLDISDAVNVTVEAPGGGGFVLDPYFVEGVHEECRPLGVDDYDDVTMHLDLSARAYWDAIPPGWLP